MSSDKIKRYVRHNGYKIVQLPVFFRKKYNVDPDETSEESIFKSSIELIKDWMNIISKMKSEHNRQLSIITKV